jgi:cysteinyl-tRNA synthetase
MGFLQSTPEWKLATRDACGRREEDRGVDCRPQRGPQSQELQEADRIRDELTAMGIQLKDARDPPPARS